MQLHSPQLSLALAFFVQEPTLPAEHADSKTTKAFGWAPIQLNKDSAMG